MSLRIPVVTGVGIISAAGCDLQTVWASIRAGQSGLGPLTLFASPRYAHHAVGQVRQDVNQLAGKARGSRTDKLALIAAEQALADAGWAKGFPGLNQERVGVVLGSTVGGMLNTEQFLQRLFAEQRHRFGLLRFHECANAADLCARTVGATGPCATISTACSAGAMAIAAAAELIEAGETDVMLAGGSDSLCRLTLNGFGSLLLLDPKGCRPFDATRTGISLGEGAAVLVLEAEETARARGARVLARLIGWGASCDAWHATAPHPDGDGAWLAMNRALEHAHLPPSAINYVSAHGTGTPDNDAMEAKALKRLFGESLPPVASMMRYFGHTLAASGAIKAVLCVQSLREQAIPPNLGLQQPDLRLGLEPVNAFRKHELTYILSNSFGFGGNNMALVFAHPEAAIGHGKSISNPRCVDHGRVKVAGLGSPESVSRFAVVGAGTASAAGNNWEEIRSTFSQGGATPSLFDVPASSPSARMPVYACQAFDADLPLEPSRRRKLSRLQQMTLAAARHSIPSEWMKSTPSERICVAMGTGLGSLNDTAAFVENLVRNEERAPRPLFFSNSVHNSLAAQIAMEFKLTGLNSTVTHREISFEAALWQSARELAQGRADFALVGAADELNQYLLATGLRWGWWQTPSSSVKPPLQALEKPGMPGPGEGCAMFTLARESAVSQALGWVNCIRIGRWKAMTDGRLDAQAEAEWIAQTLGRDGESLGELDLILTGVCGQPKCDAMYQTVLEALSKLAGRRIPHGRYKQACGDYLSASAFGFLTALGLVREEIPPSACLCSETEPWPSSHRCRMVVLYTLSLAGTRGMCCIRA